MKEKDIKRQVKLLARQKKYEQIYYEYGPQYFREYVSSKYRRNDIRKLKQEGKYLDIYTKYGENYLNYREVYKTDISNELGRKATLRERIFNKSFLFSQGKNLKLAIRGFIIGLSGSLLGSTASVDIEKAINSQKYAKEIIEYENGIKEYAKKFHTEAQSDMEVIMRVMKDMHETIRGYGQPEMDVRGYLGMDVMNEDGIGVCRNMAENVADKLNQINPEYNARTVVLYMEASDFKSANIEKNIIDGNNRLNIDKNVRKEYVGEELKKIIIDKDDETVIYEFENGMISKITMTNLKERKEISYNEEGVVLSNVRTVKEQDGDNEIEKTFIDGILNTVVEKNQNYYKDTIYDNNGQIEAERIADEESQRTIFYNGGKVYGMTILKDGYKTMIDYDEQGNETMNMKEESDEVNIFLELKEIKKEHEELEKRENSRINEEGKIALYNHAIVAVDIKGDNVTLLIDPTNIGLGVYKDGKIIMFNEKQPSEAIYDRSFIGESLNEGIIDMLKYPVEYGKSFIEPNLSMEKLEEKYGLEAQNQMLEKIEKEDEKESSQSKFKDDLKIDTGVTYNDNRNVIDVDKSKMKSKNQREH